jgi:hypothetical protein
MDARARSINRNAVAPLLVCVAALAAATLVLALIASGLMPGGGSAPPWSGAKGPPGAVGLGPAHSALHGR